METEAGRDLCPQWGPCRKKPGPFMHYISWTAAHRLAVPMGRLKLRPGCLYSFADLGRWSGPTQFHLTECPLLQPRGHSLKGQRHFFRLGGHTWWSHFLFQGTELLPLNYKPCLVRNSSEIFKPKIKINFRGNFCSKSRKLFIPKHMITIILLCLLSLLFYIPHSILMTTLRNSCDCHLQMRRLKFKDV